MRILEVESLEFVVSSLGASLWVVLDDDCGGQVYLWLERAVCLLSESVRYLLFLLHLLFQELILPFVEVFEVALEHLVALGHLLTCLRYVGLVRAGFTLCKEVSL